MTVGLPGRWTCFCEQPSWPVLQSQVCNSCHSSTFGRWVHGSHCKCFATLIVRVPTWYLPLGSFFQGQIEFSPPLPYNKQRLIQNMPPSHLIKFIATYATAFWRKTGLSGEMARSTAKGVCENNPIAITFDGTSSNGSPAILGFITSYAAAKWSTVTVLTSNYRHVLLLHVW